MKFFVTFELSWILSWTFTITDKEIYKTLSRKTRVKWWNGMDTYQGDITTVSN